MHSTNDSFKFVKEVIRENLKIKTSLSDLDGTTKIKRDLQHFLCLRFEDESVQKLYENTMSHAILCETRCPGTGVIFLKKLSGFSESTKTFVKPKEKSEIVRLISDLDYTRFVKNVLIQIVNLCSKDTKITLKATDKNVYCVELSDGYLFDLEPLIKQDFVSDKCRLICIDGYIESVSEIHHVFQSIAEFKEPLVLFTRGMSDDVLHTIKINNDSGKFSIIPIKVKFDIDQANILVDIAVIAGCDVISSLKGQTISSITLSDMPRVDHVSLKREKLMIKNPSTTKNVMAHVNRIKEQISKRPEVSEILIKRLSSLTSNCVEISVGAGIDQRANMQQLDEGIRIISAVIQNRYEPTMVVDEVMNSFKTNCLDLFTISNQ